MTNQDHVAGMKELRSVVLGAKEGPENLVSVLVVSSGTAQRHGGIDVLQRLLDPAEWLRRSL
jgi:hypothetical protein